MTLAHLQKQHVSFCLIGYNVIENVFFTDCHLIQTACGTPVSIYKNSRLDVTKAAISNTYKVISYKKMFSFSIGQ